MSRSCSGCNRVFSLSLLPSLDLLWLYHPLLNLDFWTSLRDSVLLCDYTFHAVFSDVVLMILPLLHLLDVSSWRLFSLDRLRLGRQSITVKEGILVWECIYLPEGLFMDILCPLVSSSRTDFFLQPILSSVSLLLLCCRVLILLPITVSPSLTSRDIAPLFCSFKISLSVSWLPCLLLPWSLLVSYLVDRNQSSKEKKSKTWWERLNEIKDLVSSESCCRTRNLILCNFLLPVLSSRDMPFFMTLL